MVMFGSRLDAWRQSRLSGIAVDVATFVAYAVRRFYTDRMMQAAGALTYTTLLALVPLFAIAFSIFSAFPAFDVIQDRLQEAIFENLVPEVGHEVRNYLSSFTRNTTNLTAVGVVALGVSAVLLLSTIESTLNTVWRVERQRPIVIRLLIFWTLLTLGPLLLAASLSLTTDIFALVRQLAGDGIYVQQTLASDWALVERPVAALIQSIAFTLLFYVVPARSVHIRDAAIGGVIAGVGFEVLKWGFKAYLEAFPTYQTIYGAVAVFPIFLIWMYLSWTIVIIGAVFAAAFPEWWRSRDPMVGMDLSPGRRLEVAVALIGVLIRRTSAGGPVSHDELAEAVPLDDRDSLMEALRTRGYLVVTDEDGVALARDPRTFTLADLARDLNLTLGVDSATSEVKGSDTLTRIEVEAGTVPSLLRRLGTAESEILGADLASVVTMNAPADDEGRPGIVAIPARVSGGT